MRLSASRKADRPACNCASVVSGRVSSDSWTIPFQISEPVAASLCPGVAGWRGMHRLARTRQTPRWVRFTYSYTVIKIPPLAESYMPFGSWKLCATEMSMMQVSNKRMNIMSTTRFLAAKAMTHWARWLPQKTAELREAGTFEMRATEAAAMAASEIRELMSSGFQEHEAEEVVLPEYILLKPERGVT